MLSLIVQENQTVTTWEPAISDSILRNVATVMLDGTDLLVTTSVSWVQPMRTTHCVYVTPRVGTVQAVTNSVQGLVRVPVPGSVIVHQSKDTKV